MENINNKKIRLKFSQADIQERKIFFPKDFLWGTSTSAYQVEGGINNNWSQWEKSPSRQKKLKKKGLDPRDHVCGQAVDSYNRWEEDLDLAKGLNTNAVRLGLEWARIQPQKNTWDKSALDHYRQVLEGAQERGLKTAVTLWHWTSPVWLEKEKSFCKKNAVRCYRDYVSMIIRELGGLVDYWITLNEPLVPVFNGYIKGKFPPGKKYKFFKAGRYYRNLIKAHIEGYKAIHEYFPKARVGITNLINYYEPARPWLLPEIILAKSLSYFINYRILDSIKRYSDFIGFDYYFHDRLVWRPPFRKNFNEYTTDMGWEIHPPGIYKILQELAAYDLPIYVMENGLADKEDKHRAQFIKEHLYWIYRAIKEGVDVRGYFHWSLLDNFEWADGWEPKFGLHAVDRKTFARTPRKSAEAYAEICKNNSVNL